MSVIDIETFRVKNYKPIKDSGDMELGDMTTFIGKNDAGKSSFLEALELFLDCGKPDDEHFHMQEAEEICFEAEVRLPEELCGLLREEYVPEDNDTVTVLREFSRRSGRTPGSETYLNGETFSKGAINEDDTRLTKAKSRDRVWDFFPEPVPIFAERDVSEETKLKGGTHMDKLLSPILESGGFDNEVANKKAELRESLTETTEKVGSHLTNYLETHLESIEQVEMSPGNIRVDKAITPSIELHDEHLSESVDVRERGSGVGSLLQLSMMQAYVDFEVSEGYILLFEEPGNFLHPSAERKMLDALREIAGGGGQVVLTTHSQVFIDNRANADIYVTRREDGATEFERVADEGFEAVREIGARNSDILQSDFVIYVEGQSDVEILKRIAEEVIDDWHNRGVTILPLGGTGNMQHCDPAKLKKINQNFAILLDSDRKEGAEDPKQESVELRNRAANADVPCHILKRREIENYFDSDVVADVVDLPAAALEIDDYCDVEERVERRAADHRTPDGPERLNCYDKRDHGRRIVEEMYHRGRSIDEVEQFLQRHV
ncbi:ATP-dependent endonuclease [Halobaculum sp. MBLA0143]|uniref:ATP-dependent nuclease n=1 Tax=Halobaculum sp. MBLA0143 TaxID=3079933 RepID=UPI00352454ED